MEVHDGATTGLMKPKKIKDAYTKNHAEAGRMTGDINKIYGFKPVNAMPALSTCG